MTLALQPLRTLSFVGPRSLLVVINGELRREEGQDRLLPVVVLDVTEEEAETLLLATDGLASMALPDEEALALLLDSAVVPDAALAEHLARSLHPLGDRRRWWGGGDAGACGRGMRSER